MATVQFTLCPVHDPCSFVDGVHVNGPTLRSKPISLQHKSHSLLFHDLLCYSIGIPNIFSAFKQAMETKAEISEPSSMNLC